MAYHIKNTCLCCHNCALECPVGAIDYHGTHYAIDNDLCIECGHCAEVCNVGAACCDETEEAVRHEPVHKSCDLLVIGAGACGTVAAVRAAGLSGKKVIVLEKAQKPGGSAWFASGGISIALDGKLPSPPSFGTENIREKLDPDIVAGFDKAAEDIGAWYLSLPGLRETLEEQEMFGCRILAKTPGRFLYNKLCKDEAIGPGKGGSHLIYSMLSQFDRLGIELVTGTAVDKLLLDGSGAICGAEAHDAGGEVIIDCRAIVCATGGYAWNDELLKKYVPWFFAEDPKAEPAHRFAAPTVTGDIVALGHDVGAFVDDDKFFCNLFGPVHHPFSFNLFKACCQPEIIDVGLDGKRFYNEEHFTNGGDAILRQPMRYCWTIMDSKTMDTIAKRLVNDREPIPEDEFWGDVDEEVRNGFPVKKADTLEELAEKCGVDKARFLETIRRYNGFCAAGRDEDFGKTRGLSTVEEGPFYAVYCKTATDGAFGGVRINGRGEVYNESQTGVIPGLFAGGDNAAGWAYNAHQAGDHRMMITNEIHWAQISGFMAGTAAGEYIG